MRKKVVVNDKMQKNYVYYRTEPEGKHFSPEFKPELSPKKLLEMGVFGGKYMTDGKKEFPKWFALAKLSPQKHDAKINYFKVNASQPRAIWKEKGWLYREDPRGWFQWYCRYYSGRRCPDDERQIKRWKAIQRHVGAVKKNCKIKELTCRPRERQALLHWAIDSRKI